MQVLDRIPTHALQEGLALPPSAVAALASSPDDESFCEVREVRFTSGKAPRTFAFPFNSVIKAYEVLGWRRDLSTNEMKRRAKEIICEELPASEEDPSKPPSPRLGAILVVSCSRTTFLHIRDPPLEFQPMEGFYHGLYLAEVQYQLQQIRLPLPPGSSSVPSLFDFTKQLKTMEMSLDVR
ncbi:hypothetical protein JCM6882_005194 [Rhodosporidiobolus microsporus]